MLGSIFLLPFIFPITASYCIPVSILVRDEVNWDETRVPDGSVNPRSWKPGVERLRRSSEPLCDSIARPSDKEIAKLYVSTNQRAVLISVLISVSCVLLVLLLLKLTYLKKRRLQTIHELPILLAICEEDDEQEANYGYRSPRVAYTPPTVNRRYSQASRAISNHLSIVSSSEDNHGSICRRPDSAPAILVGLLGSPDWETSMQRELADHEWRLRRESRDMSLNSQNRSTWNSYPSNTYSRNSTMRSRPERESSVTGKSGERRAHRSGKHSSLRLPHVSSFGEMSLDTFRGKRKRPKSLNAVVDRMSASRSGISADRSRASNTLRQSGSGSDEATRGGFPASFNVLSQRPSTIHEADTPRSLLSHGNDTDFRFQVIDYGDGAPLTNSAVESSRMAPTELRAVSRENRLAYVDMGMSSTYEHLNTSRDSSIGGSWRQLPQFPSPPGTPISPALATPEVTDALQVNTVCVEPRYMNEQLYSDLIGTKPSSSDFLNASNCGLGLFGKGNATPPAHKQVKGFDPSTMDFGWPALSDLLISDLLNLGFSSPVIEGEYKNSISAQLFPTVSPTECTISPQKCLVQEGTTRGSLNYSGHLSPLAGTVLNRHHSRVLEHVPFSLVPPPPAYLRSSRSFEPTVRFASGREIADGETGPSICSLHASSLVDLSTPVRPSPLRRIASMGSSRASSKGTGRSGNISKESDPDVEDLIEHDCVRAEKSSLSLQDTGADISQGMMLTRACGGPAIKPKASYASLFLDLGGSSTALGDDSGELSLFDGLESAGTSCIPRPGNMAGGDAHILEMERSFGYSQASSDILVVEECSDEDIQYIVELHSDAFADA